jgi:hypothetical protein
MPMAQLVGTAGKELTADLTQDQQGSKCLLEADGFVPEQLM